MSTTVLRIYMPIAAKIRNPKTFWQKFFGTSLAHFLVKKAKEAGVKQAIVQRVEAGYLPGQRLVFDQVEAVPPSLPLCVELIEEEKDLLSFVNQNRDQLEGYRVILFKAAELMKLGANERQGS